MAQSPGEQFHEKLQGLVSTQEAIQTLTFWVIHFQAHATSLASVWEREFLDSRSYSHRLVLVYLLNELLHMARRKADSVGRAFAQSAVATLPLLVTAHSRAPSEIREKVERVLDVWLERKIMSARTIAMIRTGRPKESIAPHEAEQLSRATASRNAGAGSFSPIASVVPSTSSADVEDTSALDSIREHPLPRALAAVCELEAIGRDEEIETEVRLLKGRSALLESGEPDTNGGRERLDELFRERRGLLRDERHAREQLVEELEATLNQQKARLVSIALHEAEVALELGDGKDDSNSVSEESVSREPAAKRARLAVE